MYHHPKYYKEMRKLAQELRQKSSSVNQRDLLQASSPKPQADESFKQQASSPKQQASSSKPQAASSVIREPENIWISFEDLGPRASAMMKVLFGCVLWKAIWWGENFNLFPRVTFNSTVKSSHKYYTPTNQEYQES